VTGSLHSHQSISSEQLDAVCNNLLPACVVTFTVVDTDDPTQLMRRRGAIAFSKSSFSQASLHSSKSETEKVTYSCQAEQLSSSASAMKIVNVI
jgi:hypothetical protein